MPYVICVLTNVPFLAHKVLNEFIWNNFHPHVAKHLANKVLKCAFGSCIWWQCVGIEIIRNAGWGKEDRRLQSRDTTHSLGSPWKEVTPVPPFPSLHFLSPFNNPACLESIKGVHQIRQGIISLCFLLLYEAQYQSIPCILPAPCERKDPFIPWLAFCLAKNLPPTQVICTNRSYLWEQKILSGGNIQQEPGIAHVWGRLAGKGRRGGVFFSSFRGGEDSGRGFCSNREHFKILP